MNLYDDNWSTRREPITVPYLHDDDEDDEPTERDWDSAPRWPSVVDIVVVLYPAFVLAVGFALGRLVWPR